MKLSFLGTGTSVGIPMIGCHCATCTSSDPRDQRLRTGLLVEHEGRRLVIDVSTDFRQQALRAGLTQLDAVLITHCHADHVFGLDDIRPFNFRHGPIDIYASARTWRDLRRVFYYIFEAKHTGAKLGGGLPQLVPHELDDEFASCGLRITPFPVIHGRSEVTGFRFHDGRRSFAFITDCNEIPAASLAQLHGLDLLILDALRLKPHTTHLHLAQSLAYIEQLQPRRALLTHISHDLQHAEISATLPAGVELAYDGLQIEL
jgi:phosphoribosyl 1,2-cyclic phosphate phosphodiesterase